MTLLLKVAIFTMVVIQLFSAEENSGSYWNIKFEDKVLENVAREISGKKTEEIFIKDLINVEKLNLSEKGLSSLKGLRYFTGLKEIDLSYNNITDISELQYLENLETVNLSGNKITDYSVVSKIKKVL